MALHWKNLTTIAALGATVALIAASRRRRLDLNARVAIVTGGGRGLGLAITRALTAEGCSVAICGRDGATVDQTVQSLRQQGAEVWGMACDVSDPEQIAKFVDAVLERYQRIDILVNNAGQCFVGPAAELTSDDMQSAMRNIFWSQYCPTMAVLPHLLQRRFGRIVNVTSIGGKLPVPHQAAYVAAKYAATGWSETLALELRREGIEVSTVTPPPLHNGAPLHTHFNGDRDAEFTWFAQTLTSRLTSTSPERVARVIVSILRGRGGERSVSAMTWLLTRSYGLAPNMTTRCLSLLARTMPPLATPLQRSSMQLGAEVAQRTADPRVKRLAAVARHDETAYLPR